MKNRIFILCVLSVIAIFTSAQEKFTIKGTVGNEMNGQQLYLHLLEDGQEVKDILLDSAEVKKGKFSFVGVQEKPRIAIIKRMDKEMFCPLILEKGKIVVDVEANRRRGTSLNDTLDRAVQRMQPAMDTLMALEKELQEFMKTVKPEEMADKMRNDSAFKAKFEGYGRKGVPLKDSILQCVNVYKGGLAGVCLFTWGNGMLFIDDIKKIAEGASPVFLEHALVKKVTEQKERFRQMMDEAMEKRMPKEELERREKRTRMEAKVKIGDHFPDGKMKDKTGKEVALSDYVGKEKHVLIDFWASWCGPCRREMPNVKAAFEKYASKGFEVISISTDAKQKDWENAVQELGMTWTQMLDVETANIYGVFSIPTTFLVDPNGTIIAKNLRGNELEETLSKIFPPAL